MNITFLKGGVLEAIDRGFIHINPDVRPVPARTGDIIIAEYGCTVGGRAVAHATAQNISLFITGAGAAKLYYWCPVERPWEKFAQQLVAADTPHVQDAVACWMVEQRFGEKINPIHGVAVARGSEGARVRKIYKEMAQKYGVEWRGRKTTGRWRDQTPINRTLSLCNAALYGLTEIAILHAGYSPYFGFMHGRTGKGLVYDIADMVKFERIVPIAFAAVADGRPHPEWRARAACIRLFRRCGLLRELISITERTMEVAFESLSKKPPHRRWGYVPSHMAKNR